MVGIRSILVLCAVLICSTYAATGTISFTNIGSQPVGITSPPVFGYADEAPNGTTIAVGIKATDPAVCELSADQATFDSTTRSNSFRVKCVQHDAVCTLEFTTNGDDNGQFFTIPPLSFFCLKRTVTFETLPQSVEVNIPSEPLKITLSYPSAADLHFTPVIDDPELIIEPSPVVIAAGSLCGSFIQRAAFTGLRLITISWNIAGEEADWYQNLTTPSVPYISSKRTFRLPAFSTATLLDHTSTTLFVSTNDMVNNTVTLTPKAADTVFTPSTLEFTPGMNVREFTYVTTTSQTPKPIFYYIDGPGSGDYIAPNEGTFAVPKRTISFQYPANFIITKKTMMSVRISAPAHAEVIVTCCAANLEFNPTNVTFSGTTTAHTIELLPTALGVDTVKCYITGADAEYYNTIADTSVSVVKGAFIGPAEWYIPALWLGVESDKFPIRVNVPPPTNVTICCSSNDLIFNPPCLSFTPTTLQQYLQITPSYTSTAATVGTVSNPTITFLVTGDDYTLFTAPAQRSVTVSRRSIQTSWSSHLTSTAGVLSLYLGKVYNVWVTANYVNKGETVTVTATSPYVTCNPAVVTFTGPDNLRVQVSVTVTAVASGTNSINWIIGGEAAGHYTNVPSTAFTSSIRPLAINSAVISPNDKVPGTLITTFASAYLGSDHVYAFSLSSSVVPDAGITITPMSHHITFTPPSIELGNKLLTVVYSNKQIARGDYFVVSDYTVVANFTTTPKSFGAHEVWFQVTGADAPYYDIPDHILMSFKSDNRVVGEMPAPSAATTLATSSVLVVIAVILAFVL